jgi:hypothetical protein
MAVGPAAGAPELGRGQQSNLFWKEAAMPLKLEDHLFSLEEKFWTEGRKFYQENLTDSAIMVFPEPAGILVEDEIVSSVGEQGRWKDINLEEHRVLELSDGSAVVTYKATARRARDGKTYVARASSAYVRGRYAWKLAFHQQTPIGPGR